MLDLETFLLLEVGALPLLCSKGLIQWAWGAPAHSSERTGPDQLLRERLSLNPCNILPKRSVFVCLGTGDKPDLVNNKIYDEHPF